MVFDTPRVECVLFGGNDGTGAGLGDTWGLGFYASCVSMGQGCTGSNGLVPLLDCTPPILGQSWTIVVSNLPVASGSCSAGQPYLMWAFPPPIHFELDLTPYHAPGCQLSLPWIIPPIAGTNDNGVATWVVPLPNDKAFLGIPLVIRGLVVDPCANQLMVTTSNYAVATFGSR